MYKDPNRRRLPLSERLVQVIDDRQTGETLLDEALKMMKAQEAVERMSVNSWIDLLSGACRSLCFILLQCSVYIEYNTRRWQLFRNIPALTLCQRWRQSLLPAFLSTCSYDRLDVIHLVGLVSLSFRFC